MPLPGDQRAAFESSNVIYKSSDDIDIISLKLATSDDSKDNRTMEEELSSSGNRQSRTNDTSTDSSSPPVVEASHQATTTTTITRRKIIPSVDLLRDCYSTDSSNPDVDQTSCSGQTSVRTSIDNIDNISTVTSVKTSDSLATLDLFEDSVFDGELDWIDSRPSSGTGTLTTGDHRSRRPAAAADDRSDQWSTVVISDKEYRLDLKVIEPYKRVISHGGYYGDGYNAIIVITACYLPDKGRRDYHYVMRNLFLYVISTLELLVMDDYMVIYFHGAAPRQRMPSFRWLRQCYEMTDRRYKKKLKKLLIVHPTFFLRTVILMTKPFISSKFYCKLQYVRGLDELRHLVPMDHVFVCDEVKSYDALRPLENANSQ